MKARDMNVDQYIKWDRRRAAICRAEAGIDWRDTDLRMYRALVTVDGLSGGTVVGQVSKDIERLAGSEAALQDWAIY